jgi:hypothetical protein
MGFLHRVVNEGRFVFREYGVGMGRVDLPLRWPLSGRRWRRESLELDVWGPKNKSPLGHGLARLGPYLVGLGLHTRTRVPFDPRPGALAIEEWSQRSCAITPKGHGIGLLGA